MKISKVNHKRSAVGEQSKKQMGFLYESPKKKQDVKLRQHVIRQNKASQDLYQVFICNEKNTENDRQMSITLKILEYCRELFDSLLSYSYKEVYNRGNRSLEARKPEDCMSLQSAMLEELPIRKIFNGKTRTITEISINFDGLDKDKMLAYIVDGCLRSALRRNVKQIYVPDVMKKLIAALFQSENSIQAYHAIPQKEIKAMLTVLNNDYMKTEQIQQIITSIERQNVKVSPKQTQQGWRLQLSSAENKKKKYIFQFLIKYTEADEQGQNQMLIHFRELVLLFYCGRETYRLAKESADIGAWTFGSLKPESSACFCEAAYILMNELAQTQEDVKKRALRDSLKNALRSQVMHSYRAAAAEITEEYRALEENRDENIFWLRFIEDSVDKLIKKPSLKSYMLSQEYLCSYTWKEFISFIAMKYIDLGKAVYHFAIPDLRSLSKNKKVVIGEVLPEYRKGITSFDYERVKAEESFDRSLSIYIAFAVENFAGCVYSSEERMNKGKEDILNVGLSTVKIYPDADRRVLRFFGGKSTWNEEYPVLELLETIKRNLAMLRNSSFHYTNTSLQDSPAHEKDIIRRMFEKEYAELGIKYRKKYYSNNLPMFYSEADITRFMDKLYNQYRERPAQIPAFNKIINKANLPAVMQELIDMGSADMKVLDSQNMDKFRHALFFALKEAYYYGFLQEGSLKKRFLDAMEDIAAQRLSEQEKRAMADFGERMDEIKNSCKSIGEICQKIMTEYELQNNGTPRVKPNKKGNADKIYKHFPMILYRCLRVAYINYLKEQSWLCFLQKPMLRDMPEEEQFCNTWKTEMFHTLKTLAANSQKLLSWYTMAHFLNPKQLNLLIGGVRSYIHNIEDINVRADSTKNRKDNKAAEKIRQYKEILLVLDFAMLYCGQVSNEITDYFADEEEYAQYIGKFVDLGESKQEGRIALKQFCDQRISKGSPDKRVGLFYDGLHPILNRNIALAGMYGNIKLLSACVDKITYAEVQEYYEKMEKLSEVFRRGNCVSEEEQRSLVDFQQRKNRIEFVDLIIYSEIVNDFVSQMISWAYLRERDFLYMQLGYHYVELYHGKALAADDWRRRLEGEEIHIADGGLLYQLIAMYTYDLPLYKLDKEGKAVVSLKPGASIPRCIGDFYKEYCHRDDSIYNAGLCFFENLKEHDTAIVDFRNYIDHFKYYATLNMSILEQFSEVYDSFFSYDTKLRKSVSFIFSNILLDYFVIAGTSFEEHRQKSYGKKMRRAARMKLRDRDGLCSDIFTYKIMKKNQGKDEEQKLLVNARSEKFLEQLRRILEYSEGSKKGRD